MNSIESGAPPRAEGAPWLERYWFVVPAAIAICSRLYSALLLAGQNHVTGNLPLLVGDTSPFVAWDGQWYLHITEFGYHATPVTPFGPDGGHHDFAFYPGWPVLIRIVTLNGALPLPTIAVLAANVLFVLAAVVIYRFFQQRFSSRTALGGILMLAFAPPAYVFSMAYTEPLFLLLAGLYFANQFRRWSPALAGLSMWVRVSGLAIGASALTEFVLARNGRLRPFLTGTAVVVAFALWWLFIWRLTGKFTGWFEGSAHWLKYEGVVSILHELRTRAPFEVLWLMFVTFMIGGSALLLRRQPELAVYGLVAIGLSLVAAPGSSMPRHSIVAFPAFAAVADRVGARTSAVIAVIFAVGQIAFVDFAFGPLHRPP